MSARSNVAKAFANLPDFNFKQAQRIDGVWVVVASMLEKAIMIAQSSEYAVRPDHRRRRD